MSLRQRLRDETRRLHEQTETIVDIPNRLISRVAYRGYLQRLYGLLVPIEALLNEPGLIWPGLAPFHRAALIATDLRDLGVPENEIATTSLAMEMSCASPAAALGIRYVIEGSALGGRMIFRQHSTELGLTAGQGGRYLAGTDEVQANWRQLVAVLDAIPATGETAEATLQGATATFTLFGEWFAA
jgi:heme oxygenase